MSTIDEPIVRPINTDLPTYWSRIGVSEVVKELYRVRLDGKVHAYVKCHHSTLCGLNKERNARNLGAGEAVVVSTAVDCTTCIDAARAWMISKADAELGLDARPTAVSA